MSVKDKTVALKFDKDKLPIYLVEPVLIDEVAKVLKVGAEKYGEENWKEGGISQQRYYSAAMRHMLAYRDGEFCDPESGLMHLSHAACNLMFMLYKEGQGEGL